MRPDTFNLPPIEETTTTENVGTVSVEQAYFDEQFAVMMGPEIAAEAAINAKFDKIVSSELEEVHLIGESLHGLRQREATLQSTAKKNGIMAGVLSLFKDII